MMTSSSDLLSGNQLKHLERMQIINTSIAAFYAKMEAQNVIEFLDAASKGDEKVSDRICGCSLQGGQKSSECTCFGIFKISHDVQSERYLIDSSITNAVPTLMMSSINVVLTLMIRV
jgi:hypothetical protein